MAIDKLTISSVNDPLINPNGYTKFEDYHANNTIQLCELLNAGFIDSYRYLYPEKIEYSWWSYMGHAREKNVGWRIDYFIVSNDFRENIKDATIYTEILGSDHCPVGLEIK